jgi:hypothetical protein
MVTQGKKDHKLTLALAANEGEDAALGRCRGCLWLKTPGKSAAFAKNRVPSLPTGFLPIGRWLVIIVSCDELYLVDQQGWRNPASILEERRVLQRQTQTAAFWRDQFEVTPDDLEFLYQLLLDIQTPKKASELATALVEEYMRRENAKIENELAKGLIYLPKQRYEVGQRVVFPVLEFAVGEVTQVRPGENPEYGQFEVIKVKFPDGQREFATGLTRHRLNQEVSSLTPSEKSQATATEIYSLYRNEIDESLLYALEESDRARDFVEVDGYWVLADMLAEIHVGYLNIAEALIEMQGKPIKPEQILAEVDLPANLSPAMRVMSLNHALEQDARFDRIQNNNDRLWFLKRLEPPELINPPSLLRYTPVQYNRALLSVEMLQIEWELDDEWGESSLTSEIPRIVPSTVLTLAYPHRRYGALPLNGRTINFFPTAQRGKSIVTLVDGRWGTRFNGWVVHEGRYVSGLAKWMDDHQLPVGAYITLERANTTNEVIVDYRTRRPKREWARMATADLASRRLRFEMNKVQVACEYDEYMIVAEEESAPIDQLREQLLRDNVSLAQIVEQVVPELTKLNPQGTAHAKSVYSAVNILRRSPPGPIFYALISNRRFRDVGGGFFALA